MDLPLTDTTKIQFVKDLLLWAFATVHEDRIKHDE